MYAYLVAFFTILAFAGFVGFAYQPALEQLCANRLIMSGRRLERHQKKFPQVTAELSMDSFGPGRENLKR